MATSGPGAIHLLNGLYDAQMDHQPVVAIVGQSRAHRDGRRLPAGSRSAVAVQGRRASLRPRVRCTRRQRATRSIERCGSRIAERAVTCVIVPNDVQELDGVDAPPREHNTTLTGIGYHRPRRRSRARRSPGARRTSSTRARRSRSSSARARSAQRHEVMDSRGDARRRRREGAARQGGARRRPAVRDRLDRPARHRAERQADEAVRHAADDRLELPVRRVLARRKARRAAFRSTSSPRMLSLRYPMEVDPPRRCRADAARAAAAARSARTTARGATRSKAGSRSGGR